VGRISTQLAGPAQDDLGPSVLALHLAFDFDLAAFESPDIAHLLKIAGQDDHREWADSEVLAEVEKVHASVAKLHVQNVAGYTSVRTDVFQGV